LKSFAQLRAVIGEPFNEEVGNRFAYVISDFQTERLASDAGERANS
jgi:hypothetical protein